MTEPRSVRHALVLTAGLGTRLRPLTLVRAKPAIPVLGEPLVARIVRWLGAAGIDDLVLNLHYMPETVAAALGDGSAAGVRVRYSWDQPILGSAGGPRLAVPIVGADPFLIVNGDTLTDLDLRALTAAHRRSGAVVTMALVANEAPERYGGVRLDTEGRVTGFARKGTAAVGSYHFVGVQVAAAAAFDAVVPGTAASSVGEVYDRLIAERPGSVRGHVVQAGFWDIGSVGDYWQTSVAFARRTSDPQRLGRGDDVQVAAGATVRRSILWDHVQIGVGALIDECIVTDNVAVPAGAQYRRAILVAGDTGLRVTPFDPDGAESASPEPPSP
jgi:NDP-sugar pyrophosphorylase family protein